MARSILDIVIRTIKQGGGDKETVKGLVDLKKGIGSAVTAFTALAGAAYTVDKALDATVGKFVQYAEEVEKAQVLTGATAEETSRIIQMADDARVSYDSLMKSLKAANKDGFQPNIDGLAQLSDQFLAIHDPVQRANFLFDTFGKEGADMEKIMRLGSTAIRERSAAVQDGLVVDKLAIAQMRLYKAQLDDINDAVDAAKISIGQGLVGVLTGSTAEIRKNAQEIFKQANGYEFNTNQMGRYTEAQRAAWKEAERLATEQFVAAQGIDATGEAAQNALPSLEELAAQNKALLDLTFDLQDGYDKFGEKEREIRAEMEALNASFAQGDVTAEEYNSKMADLTGQLGENAKAMEDWSKRTVFSLVQARLAASGGIDAKEFSFLVNLGEQMGIIDKDTATMAQNVNNSLDAIDLSKPEDFVNLWKEIIGLPHDQIFTITTNSPLTGMNIPSGYNPGMAPRAIGGPVSAGDPYLVHQDEIFVPQQNGFVVTRTDAMKMLAAGGGGGGGKNVTVYGGLTVIAQGGVMDVLDELS